MPPEVPQRGANFRQPNFSIIVTKFGQRPVGMVFDS
jgi:hypothetical protein